MMSCKVEKFQSAKKRKGLRATVSVSPGEVLYVAEPFVYTVKEIARGFMCEFCLKRTDLLRCSQCKYAKYCSKLCQANAWPDHKRECKCLDGVFTSDYVDFFRLAIRVIFKMIQNVPCPSENLCSLFELDCNTGHSIKELESIAQKLLGYMKNEIAHPSELPDELDLTKIVAVVELYRSLIFNDTLDGAGVGLYPGINLLKHSCNPNCSIAFMGTAAHLRSIRKIRAGEELTTAMFLRTRLNEPRDSILGLGNCTMCECRRCRTHYLDKITLAGDKQASNETKDMIKVLVDLRLKNHHEDVLLVCKSQLKRNAGRLPDENIYQQQVLRFAVNSCLALVQPKEGLLYAYRLLKVCRNSNTKIGYGNALLLRKVACLECLGGNRAKACKTMSEAADILEFFLGKNHPMTKELRGEN